jgi:hypothetical protein
MEILLEAANAGELLRSSSTSGKIDFDEVSIAVLHHLQLL